MVHKNMAWVLILTFTWSLAGFSFQASAAGTEQNTKGSAADQSTAAPANAQEKAAVVNGEAIMKADVDKETDRYQAQMAMSGQAPDEAQVGEMKKKVLDGMISRVLLKQESQKLGIKAEEAEVNDQIEKLKKRFPSEAEFTTTLSKMNVTEADLKKQISQDLAMKKLVDQKVSSKVTVSDEETKAFYDGNAELFKVPEMVRASHILIQVDPKASDADKAKAREKLADIQQRVKKGEDFAALAKEFSNCPSSANGGDLDFFQRGQMVGPFEETAFALQPGQMSDIVETQFGYHLIKVTDRKPASVTSYEEVKERIGQHLKQEKVNQQLVQYVDQLKSQAKIETSAP